MVMPNNEMKQWINGKYLKNETINKLKNTFRKNRPYPYLELKDFLNEEKAKGLLLALSKERFYPKEADLFSFFQTNDIASSKNKILLEFREFLASEGFISYMENLTGLKLGRGKIDLAGSLYRNTNYLLCHDDELEGRSIAFLLYLSTLDGKDGGSLNLMDGKLQTTKKLIPGFNTFTFFHEVEEVVNDKQRIALGGWLHDK